MAQWVKHLLSKYEFELSIYKCQVGLAACLEFQSSEAKTGSWASGVASLAHIMISGVSEKM